MADGPENWFTAPISQEDARGFIAGVIALGILIKRKALFLGDGPAQLAAALRDVEHLMTALRDRDGTILYLKEELEKRDARINELEDRVEMFESRIAKLAGQQG